MIDEVLAACDFDPCAGLDAVGLLDGLRAGDRRILARPSRLWRMVRRRPSGGAAGCGGRIDGARPGRHGYRRGGEIFAHRRTGAPAEAGSGRSTQDRGDFGGSDSAPYRRRALGDRIRMNAIGHPQIFMRSLSPPGAPAAKLSAALPGSDCRLQTGRIRPGDGGNRRHRPGDAAIAALADVSLYVMTPEFGAASQLEKIDMLDFADCVAINKFDRKGEDALRDVQKQVQRNHGRFAESPRPCRSSAPRRHASTTTGSPRSTRLWCRGSSSGSAARRRAAAGGDGTASSAAGR